MNLLIKNCVDVLCQRRFEASFRRIYTSVMKMDKKQHLEHTANMYRIPDMLDCKITKVGDISPTIKALTLKADNPKALTFKGGQWVDFFIPGEAQVGGFSMWNSPTDFSDTGNIELAVKFSKWPPAHWVHTQCKEGDNVQVRFGGEFFYPPRNISVGESHNILLIAGGVGINPLLSIWLHASSMYKANDKDKANSVHLLYSAVNQQELVFRDIIDTTCEETSQFKSTYFLTRTNEDSNMKMGRIKFEDVKEALSNFEGKGRTLAYLCGPPNMIRDVSQMLKKLDVPKENVYFELWY